MVFWFFIKYIDRRRGNFVLRRAILATYGTAIYSPCDLQSHATIRTATNGWKKLQSNDLRRTKPRQTGPLPVKSNTVCGPYTQEPGSLRVVVTASNIMFESKNVLSGQLFHYFSKKH